MIKTFNIDLDIEKDLYNPSNLLFTVSESDLDSIDLLFHITQDESSVDLTGSTVELGIKKPSGLTVYQEVEITNALQGEAVVRMSLQSYNEYGVYTAEIYIRGTDSLAVTSPFYYASREAILNDETLQSTNDWSAFQQALFSYDKKPVLTEGIPDFVPEYIGQMAFDTIGERAFIANSLTVGGWQLFAVGEGGTGGGGIVSWFDIILKPDVFPAEAHTHIIDDVDGLQEALDTKADIGTPAPTAPTSWNDLTDKPNEFPPAAHTHNVGDIVDLAGILDSKVDEGTPPIAHTHTIADVTGLQTELDSKVDEGTPPIAHTHTIVDVTGLQTELDSKLEIIPPEYLTESEGDIRYAFKGEGGTGGGSTLVEDTLTSTSTTAALSANQGRVLNETKSDVNHNHNDLYSPIIHTHSIDNIEGLLGVLDSKVDDTELTGYAPAIHSHTIDDVTGLGAALDGKVDDAELTGYAPVTHIHDIEDISGLTDVLNGKVDDTELTGYSPVTHTHTFATITEKPDTYPADPHSHPIAEVTGLQGVLDGKVDDAELTGYAPVTHTHDFTTDITGKPATYPPSTHTHDFASITDKPATYPATAHIHTIGDVTGLQPALDAKADDTDLAAKSDIGHTHTFAAITDKPATYPATAHTHDFTNDITGKPATYPPSTHTHDYAAITNKPTTFVPQLMTGGQIGGAMVGNGLAMAGNYLTVKQGASLGVAGDNALQVQTTGGAALRFWTGTQTTYDGLTKDANTLYFISG